MTDTLTTPQERLTFSSEVPVGTRVRLIDSGGDSSSTAVVGDYGTVLEDGTGVLTVTMDDGHTTTRNTPRWALVEETLTEAQQRDVWASLPIREAYPVGSQWHHRSYGDAVYEVTAHRGATELRMRYVSGGDSTSLHSEASWWVRGALDTFGTPVGLIPSAPVVESTDATEEPQEAPAEPYRPAVGDRVIVTNDPDTPANNGKPAEVLEVRADRIGVADRYPFRVNYDDGSGYGSWWVREVKPEMPATPEEFRAAIAAAVEKAREEALVQGKREGREAATAEAAAHMETIVESAHEYARDNQLCSQFDRFMVQNGLRPRDSYTQEYRVDVVYTVYVNVTPGDSDAIREAAMERVNDGYTSPEIDWEEN